jgi:tetratricopeptide (TPR) repeat protein
LNDDGKLTILAGSVLVLAIVAAYSNHFQNSFHFDDAHTIVTNAAIRDLRNVPLFFRDATTFSALPSNQSYRPLVSTLLAIDYRLGGGVQPFWFHLSILALFIALTFLLAFVIYRLLEIVTPSSGNVWIAGVAAAWYELHPANADTVNYIIASSEVISTLGVIASFAVYFAFSHLRRYYLYVLPAAIAILAKPPAAIFAVLFAIYRLLFPSDDSPCSHGPVGRNRPSGIGPRRKSVATTSWYVEVIPAFVICAAMLLFVQHMTPRNWIAGAANARNYLITQPYVALLYFKTFFWPRGLSADYDLNPFTTTDDPRFWAGLAFVTLLIIAAIAAAVSKKTRVIGFGLLWFLIGLLSTSALPLAEVMNDHRTFLPYVGLVIAMAGAGSLLIDYRESSLVPKGRQRLPLQNLGARYGFLVKIAASCAVALILCTSGYATFQRNKVWTSEETLWRDVTIKSPRNPRGLMNYGNTLMAKGDFNGALGYFHRALALAPQYSVLLVNLAIAEDAMKQDAAAEQHFKDALRLAPTSPDSYTYYARYLLSHSRAEEARGFLHSALEISSTDLTARELLAQAERQTSNQSATQTAESYLVVSLQRYGEERYPEVIAACRAALELRPDFAEAWNNICAAYNQLGRYEQAAAAGEQALRYKPDLQLARNNLQYARKMANASSK